DRSRFPQASRRLRAGPPPSPGPLPSLSQGARLLAVPCRRGPEPRRCGVSLTRCVGSASIYGTFPADSMAPKDSKRPFHTASDAEIKRGEVYDVYFERTVQILKARGDRKRVKAEVYLKALPEDWEGGGLAGGEEAAALLHDAPV